MLWIVLTQQLTCLPHLQVLLAGHEMMVDSLVRGHHLEQGGVDRGPVRGEGQSNHNNTITQTTPQ